MLPQRYPRDFFDYFMRKYVRFLDDIFHTFLKLINKLHPDLKFIFEELASDLKLLDINIKIVDSHLHFDIYHKPFNYFSYLKYNSCHPSHTKHVISLLLARRIMRIVTGNRDFRL